MLSTPRNMIKCKCIIIPPASTKLKGRYTGFTLSVCLSVDRIVSALYLQQYSSDTFPICTSYQATSEGVSHAIFFQKIWNFGEFFKFVTVTLSSFDLGSNINQIKSKNPLLLPVYIISGQKYTTYQKKLNTWNTTQCCNTHFSFFTRSVTQYPC